MSESETFFDDSIRQIHDELMNLDISLDNDYIDTLLFKYVDIDDFQENKD